MKVEFIYLFIYFKTIFFFELLNELTGNTTYDKSFGV